MIRAFKRVVAGRGGRKRVGRAKSGKKVDWRLSFLLPACSSSQPISVRRSGAVDRPLLTALFTFLRTLSLLLLLPFTLQHLHPFPPPPSC